ncbi:MAG: hypothetical protein LQ338_004763 [Usnochroma carphineum]|nr:MAG: hypothetical protein LQ338_004763 [Usnochroma carphineum]
MEQAKIGALHGYIPRLNKTTPNNIDTSNPVTPHLSLLHLLLRTSGLLVPRAIRAVVAGADAHIPQRVVEADFAVDLTHALRNLYDRRASSKEKRRKGSNTALATPTLPNTTSISSNVNLRTVAQVHVHAVGAPEESNLLRLFECIEANQIGVFFPG